MFAFICHLKSSKTEVDYQQEHLSNLTPLANYFPQLYIVISYIFMSRTVVYLTKLRNRVVLEKDDNSIFWDKKKFDDPVSTLKILLKASYIRTCGRFQTDILNGNRCGRSQIKPYMWALKHKCIRTYYSRPQRYRKLRNYLIQIKPW